MVPALHRSSSLRDPAAESIRPDARSAMGPEGSGKPPAERSCFPARARAFSGEVDTGSREENASKQESGASVLIQSEPIMR